MWVTGQLTDITQIQKSTIYCAIIAGILPHNNTETTEHADE